VVVSGQFLLDAESRLQDALRKFLAQRSTTAVAGDGHTPASTSAPTPQALPGAHQH
jgi:hypothetical protein